MIRNTPVVLENPADLDARSELLLASTLGCNGIAALGSQASGWSCHAIEHEVSARYDITHGIGLAILTPRLLRCFLEKAPEFLDRFAALPSASWAFAPTSLILARRSPRQVL